MIVTPQQDVIDTKGFNKPTKVFSRGKDYIVYAVYLTNGRPKLYSLFSDESDGAYEASQFEVRSDEAPSDWVYSKKSGLFRKEQVYSYPEWAKDEHYDQYLVGDDLHPDKSKAAADILHKKVVQYTEGYAIKKFGSVKFDRSSPD